MPSFDRGVPQIALLSFMLVLVSFLFQGNIGLNLVDEGFLWYGSIRTALGDIPLRDFQSYDPGRYYWTALWLRVMGTDIISFRLALAIFQWMGLTFGLLALSRVTRSYWLLVLAGCLLLMWMFPRHKFFEPSIAMAAVYFGTRLVEKPTRRHHFFAGILVGLSAFVGRNLGLYLLLGFFSLILFIRLKIKTCKLSVQLVPWAIGIFLGYSPMLLMVVLVEGFFGVFMHSIVFIAGRSLPTSIPWPWTIAYSQMHLLRFIEALFTGIFFLLLPIVYSIFSILSLLYYPNYLVKRYLSIASTFLGLMYLHHIFSRADIAHLSQGIHPFLLLTIDSSIQTFSRYKKNILSSIFLVLLIIVSFFSVGVNNPFFIKLVEPSGPYVKINITGANIWIDQHTANLIHIVKLIGIQKVQADENILMVPFIVGLYPILGRKAPLWEIYPSFQSGIERQKEMIKELMEKKVNWVLLDDTSFAGHEELRFRNSHIIVWQHFLDGFEPVPINGLPPNFQLLRRKF